VSSAFDARPDRVLVKEPNWLGDLVISLPALRAVRRAFSDAELSVLVKQELAGFFDGFPWLDRVVPYRIRPGLDGLADRGRVISTIRARGYDLAVLFPRSFESALWVTMAGVPRRAGFATQARGVLLTHAARPARDLERRHQRNDYLEMLRDALAIEVSAEEVTLEVAEPRRASMRGWLANRRRRAAAPLVALAPSAAYGPAKEWPADRYVRLIDRLEEAAGAECVLVGTASERARCAEIAAASRADAILAAGETDVGDLVALLSLCRGFIGNDSGAMHVAGALGLPTVGIFGSTRPDRTGPLGPRTRVLYERIECSPCLARTCRFGHYDCLKRISVEPALEALVSAGGVPRG
jgi:lipopolysaccharide heptosyltransferase II